VRHILLGLAVGEQLGRSWAGRLIGSHLLVDESVAFTLAQSDPRRRRLAYWTTGLSLFVAWNVGVIVGALAGRAVGDPHALGLDAAFPAALVALLLPSLRQQRPRRVAVVAVVVALATTPLVPAGLPVLLALLALPAALLPSRRPATAEGSADTREPPDTSPTDRRTQ
jgi:predicted branched-subunit amino acid permease